MLRDKGLTKVVPAAPRGGYDRARTRAERHAEQRDRLLLAVAEMFDGRDITVSRIIAHAGVSRNTFYEHFDDSNHALACVTQRALDLLTKAARDVTTTARTPFEELRSLTRAWVAVVEQQPHFVELALRHDQTSVSLSPVGRQFMAFVQAAIGRARNDALVVVAPAPALLFAAAGSAEALARAVIVGELASEPAARALFEVVARTLR